MKKIFCIIIAVCLAVLLIGCKTKKHVSETTISTHEEITASEIKHEEKEKTEKTETEEKTNEVIVETINESITKYDSLGRQSEEKTITTTRYIKRDNEQITTAVETLNVVNDTTINIETTTEVDIQDVKQSEKKDKTFGYLCTLLLIGWVVVLFLKRKK